jgi:oligopeptide transport system substrate-binding protein
MRIFCFLILLLGFLISIQSCNTKRFEHAGGTVRMALDMDMGTTVPSLVTDYYSTTVLSQIQEGLVSLDPENLKVRPQIAEAFEVSSDGLVYTFTIRPNVYFHENPIF